jgi:hypothetical protein
MRLILRPAKALLRSWDCRRARGRRFHFRRGKPCWRARSYPVRKKRSLSVKSSRSFVSANHAIPPFRSCWRSCIWRTWRGKVQVGRGKRFVGSCEWGGGRHAPKRVARASQSMARPPSLRSGKKSTVPRTAASSQTGRDRPPRPVPAKRLQEPLPEDMIGISLPSRSSLIDRRMLSGRRGGEGSVASQSVRRTGCQSSRFHVRRPNACKASHPKSPAYRPTLPRLLQQHAFSANAHPSIMIRTPFVLHSMTRK